MDLLALSFLPAIHRKVFFLLRRSKSSSGWIFFLRPWAFLDTGLFRDPAIDETIRPPM